jgi:transposase
MPASMSRWKQPLSAWWTAQAPQSGAAAAQPILPIAGVLRRHAPKARLIGLETGQLSNWLTRTLCELGLPVVCVDARHAKAALKLQVKTDANDAWGLAQIVRTGWFREVAVKSMDAQALRMLLVARTHLISQRQATANVIRGLMKTFGLVIARGASGLFAPACAKPRQAMAPSWRSLSRCWPHGKHSANKLLYSTGKSSRAQTAPTLPRQTSATIRSKPAR